MDKLKENLPLLSVFLVITSIINVLSFYNYFGISIVSYIDFTEALTIATPSFIYVGLCFIAGLFLGVMGVPDVLSSTATLQAEQQVEQRDKNFKERVLLFYSPAGYYSLVYFYPACIVGTIGFVWYQGRMEGIEWISSMCILFMIVFHTDILANEIRLKLMDIGYKLTHPKVKLLVKFICIFIGIIMSNRHRAFNIVYGSSAFQPQVSFIVNDKPVRTTANYRYIGRTKSYVFLYNILSGYADVFALSDIKSFSLKDAAPHLGYPPTKKRVSTHVATPVPKPAVELSPEPIHKPL